MEKVNEYEIKEIIQFEDSKGIALAEDPAAPSPFVTWQFTERDGHRDYYWGHYFSDEQRAREDFASRAENYRHSITVRLKEPVNKPEPTLVECPWGEIQYSDRLVPGVYEVGTAGHGGIQVLPEAIGLFSPAAVKCGFKEGGCWWFEEDGQQWVIKRELIDRGLWSVPDRIPDKAGYLERLDQMIREYNPTYWRSRERRLHPSKKPRQTAR